MKQTRLIAFRAILGYILLPITLALIGVLSLQVTSAAAQGLLEGFKNVGKFRQKAGIGEVTSLADFAFVILTAITALVTVIALGTLIWGGVMYVLALGDQERVQKAKRIIIYSLVGLLIILTAAIVTNVVINLITGGG